MKFSKFLLILGIIAIVGIFTVNASFAVSEDLLTYKGSQYISYDKKISSIDYKYVFKNKKDNANLNIKVKKDYQNKYKIKSVNTKFFVYDKKCVFKKSIYKDYNGKNKNSISIKIPKYSSIAKLTINYKTKSNLKKESTNFYMRSSFKQKLYLQSKRSKANVLEKGYNKVNSGKIIYVPTYQKIKIYTKSKNYKIKLIRFMGLNTTSKMKQNIDVVPRDANEWVAVSYEFIEDLKPLGIRLYYY